MTGVRNTLCNCYETNMSKIKHITLHHYPLSRSVRVKWLLHEMLGEDFTVKRVALRQGAQFQSEFLAKNPNHAVPVLEVSYEDGSEQIILESIKCFGIFVSTKPSYPNRHAMQTSHNSTATKSKTKSHRNFLGVLKTQSIFAAIISRQPIV